MTNLTAKQERFVDEYLIDLNATQAAIKAGYSEKGAHVRGAELLRNRKVVAAIADEQAGRSERTGVTQDYVIRSIVETMERCKQAEPVVLKSGEHVKTENSDGEEVPAYTFNANGVLKGAGLLAKHLGMFVDRVDITQNVVSAEPLSAEEWAEKHASDR